MGINFGHSRPKNMLGHRAGCTRGYSPCSKFEILQIYSQHFKTYRPWAKRSVTGQIKRDTLLLYKLKLSIPIPLCLFTKGISVNAFGIHLGGEKMCVHLGQLWSF